MPIVSGGGGGGGPAFNGGTITEGLAIADPDTAEDQLTITGLGAGSAKLINATAVHTTLTADSDGYILFSSDDTPAIDISGLAPGNGGRLRLLGSDGSDFSFHSDDCNLFVNGATRFQVDPTGLITTAVGISSSPAVSAASTLALGTAYQNTLGYDVLLCVYLSVTVNTSGVLKLGVGPTTTPTQQTLVTGITSTGLWPVPIYLPNQYYALLSTTGTITVAVDGQIAMPV